MKKNKKTEEESFYLKLEIALEDGELIQKLSKIIKSTSHKLPTKK